MKKINVLGISVFILFLLVVPTSALAWEHGISLSYGHGNPDSLDGGRISYQYHPEGYEWKSLITYFDASVAHYEVDYPSNDSITIIAIAPVFRLNAKLHNDFTPYIEAGLGAAYLSDDYLGHRDLGSQFAFQVLAGVGIAFGKNQQFDLSYHYLHYSNAYLASENDGFDIYSLLSFTYHFD